jgi:tRNA threonylcarbamoyladenosine biosynthesis protein TsaE
MRPARRASDRDPTRAAAPDLRHSSSPVETERLGGEVAGRLRTGDVVLLRGELGAGKTTFVRGAAAAIGATGRVTSPTFALANRYDGPSLRVAHLDLYRLAGLGEDDEDLIEEELSGPVIAFVEWPDPIAALVADRTALEVELRHAGGDAREIELRWTR